MRFIVCLFVCLLSAVTFALRSDRVQVQLGVSRSGAPQQTKVSLLMMGDGEQVLARGDAVRFDAVEPSYSGTWSITLDRAVDEGEVKKVALLVITPNRSGIQISQVAIALGAAYPRKVLVNQLQSRVWDGSSKRFDTDPVDEARLPISELRVSGRTVDDYREDNRVEVFVQLANGRTLVYPIAARLEGGEIVKPMEAGKSFSLSIPMPPNTWRALIKRIHVVSARSSTRLLSFYQQFYETDDIRVRNFRVDGGAPGSWFNILDLALLDMPNHKIYQSPDLSPGLDFFGTRMQAKWYNVYLYTGDDDLRWDPNVRPNMEVKVNIFLRGNASPIPIVSRSLAPYANFAEGGVFGGKFEKYCIAERKAQWHFDTRIPGAHEIEAVEVETVPGWDGSTPTRRVIRGDSDPFRQPDEWTFRGIVFGIAPDLPSGSDSRQPFEGWSTILCEFGTVRKLKVGQKVRFPVKYSIVSPGMSDLRPITKD